MIHAYNENYLSRAMRTMGSLFSLGLTGMTIEEFTNRFIGSRIARAWENANPSYLAGKSGEELYLEMMGKDLLFHDSSYDDSVELWCGYVYCYAQWYFGCTFAELFSVIPIDEMFVLYPTLHEADISKTMNIIHKRLYPESALKQLRQRRNLSQSQLAAITGVNLRSIKAYEQGDLDISKAQYDTLSKLAQGLSCSVKDLIS